MGCMKTEHDNTTDIGVCQGCLTDAEAEVTKLKLQLSEATRKGEELCGAYGNLLLAVRRILSEIDRVGSPALGTVEKLRAEVDYAQKKDNPDCLCGHPWSSHPGPGMSVKCGGDGCICTMFDCAEKPKSEGNPWTPNQDYPGKPVIEKRVDEKPQCTECLQRSDDVQLYCHNCFMT